MRLLEIAKDLHSMSVCQLDGNPHAFNSVEVDPLFLDRRVFEGMCCHLAQQGFPLANYFLTPGISQPDLTVDIPTEVMDERLIGVFWATGVFHEAQGKLTEAGMLYGWALLLDVRFQVLAEEPRKTIMDKYLLSSELSDQKPPEDLRYAELYSDHRFIAALRKLYESLVASQDHEATISVRTKILSFEPVRVLLGERFRFPRELRLLNECERAYHQMTRMGYVRNEQHIVLLAFVEIFKDKFSTLQETEDREVSASFHRIKMEEEIIRRGILEEDALKVLQESFEDFRNNLKEDDQLLVDAEMLVISHRLQLALDIYHQLFKRYPGSVYLRYQCASLEIQLKQKAPAEPAP